MAKGDLTLAILTSSDGNLVYSALVKSTTIELCRSDIETPGEPSDYDIFAAMYRVAGNACDDTMKRAMEIAASPMSRARFLTVVREAYQWKREGLW